MAKHHLYLFAVKNTNINELPSRKINEEGEGAQRILDTTDKKSINNQGDITYSL